MTQEENHWTQLQCNPFVYTPTVEMLKEGGVLLQGFFKLKGQQKKLAATYCSVRFDRDFVVKYIISRLGGLLVDIPYNELQKLISDAKKTASTTSRNWRDKV